MIISGCVWGLPESQLRAAAMLAEAGFESVDVEPGFAAQNFPSGKGGVHMSCMAAAHLLPDGTGLGDTDPSRRARAVGHVLEGIEEAARLGLRIAYVGPPSRDEGVLVRYADAAAKLAEAAEKSGVALCIEHFPGTALHSAAETLDFMEASGIRNLRLLVDVGHCLISGEDPAGTIERAGDRLGYVHFNSNDGRQDLHLPLGEGVLTGADVVRALKAIERSPYGGPVAVECSPRLKDPLGAAVTSRAALLQALGDS